MSFSDLLHTAKQGKEDALEDMIHMYQPLINKLSFIGEEFDEDLYQEQLICFLHCIKKFSENFPIDCDKPNPGTDIL